MSETLHNQRKDSLNWELLEDQAQCTSKKKLIFGTE